MKLIPLNQINPSEPKYITRSEAAAILMVHTSSILKIEKAGRMPFPVVILKRRMHNHSRTVCGYDRAGFMAWAKTNPILHAGSRDEETRMNRMARPKQHYSHGAREDVYNIQANRKGKPFVYTGLAADIILFCKNGLLSRHKYSSEE